MNKFLSFIVLTLAIACGGGSNPKSQDPVVPPVKKTYGVFRALKPKAQPMAVAKEVDPAAALTSINISSRAHHRAIQMLNGKVLICGGDTGLTPTMDVYSPGDEVFTRSAAQPLVKRTFGDSLTYDQSSFAMCNLPDGRVWIGGADGRGISGNDIIYEIYDPVLDSLTQVAIADGTPLPPIVEAYYAGVSRILFFATDGRMFSLDLTTSLLTWVPNNLLADLGINSLVNSTTVQDLNGDIYQVGGTSRMHPTPTTSEVKSHAVIFKFDVAAQTWVRKANFNTARENASVVLLPGNKLGIYGGQKYELNVLNPTQLVSVEIYDITSDVVTTSIGLVGERSKAASCYLQTGYTLIAGGFSNSGVENSELVHRADLGFSGSTGTMIHARYGHTVTPLPNGLVLITGGQGDAESPVTAEIFDPQAALYISYMSEQIVAGGTMQFTARTATGTATVIWTTSDPAVGTIDADGMFTSVAEGTTEVTATLSTDATVKAVARIRVLPL